MIPLIIEGKSIDLPVRYGELTFKQFYDIRKCDGKISTIVSILTGIPRETLLLINDLDLEDKLSPYLEFLQQDFDVQHYFVPDYFDFDGVKYPKPKELRMQSIGQKWHLEDAVREADGKDVDIYPIALAIYLQPTITGTPYDESKVNELLPKVMEMKLEQGWPLASFFLTNYEKYLNSKRKRSHTRQQAKSYVQVLTDLRNSETFQRYSLWRRLSIKLLIWLFSKITTRYTPPYFMNQKVASTNAS